MADDTDDSGDTGATGVDALIETLRSEGVAAGREEADRLIAEARAEKQRILDEADAEAKRRKEAAQQEVADMKRAAHDALEQAARDSVLELRQRMMTQFSEDVRRLVSQEVREAEIVRQMILCVARRAGEALDSLGAESITIELPRNAPGLADLRRDPRALSQDELMRLVLGVTGDRLRAGLTLRVAADDRHGIRVLERDNAIELDLTEAALAEVMLDHLHPRFRALLEGIVD